MRFDEFCCSAADRESNSQAGHRSPLLLDKRLTQKGLRRVVRRCAWRARARATHGVARTQQCHAVNTNDARMRRRDQRHGSNACEHGAIRVERWQRYNRNLLEAAV
jgi:hypothetical protein